MHAVQTVTAYKRWTILTLFGTLLSLLAAAAVVFVIDPFQYYHKMEILTPQMDARMQAYFNLGFARHYDYDTLLLGSSIAENTSTKQVEEEFGGTAINLAFSGGMLTTYDLMMREAFGTRPLRRVFISLDQFAIAQPAGFLYFQLPEYLYDKNPFNDVYYLLNWAVLERTYLLLQYNGREDTPAEIDLDTLQSWAALYPCSRRNTLLSYYYYYEPFADPLPAEGETEEMRTNIDTYLLPYIERFPETEFIFYFPPYSSLYWFSMLQEGRLDRTLYYRQFYTEELLRHENVKLFDFQACVPWVEDLDNYKDRYHYGPHINARMTEAMARDEFRITSPGQVEENGDEIRAIAHRFVIPTHEEIDELKASDT